MQVSTCPGVWDSVGLRVVMLSYPLKTSLENGQLFGDLPCAVRAGFQVALTRSRWCLSRLTMVAMIRSSVSLKFMAWNQ